MEPRFAGQSAIVTGGASGIGFAVAARLAAEGARIALWDADAEALARAREALPGAHATALDLTEQPLVEAAARATAAAFGRIDILVTSAGITGPNAPLADYPVAAWRRVMEVNVNAVFYCNRAVVPVMQGAGYGRIVNIASVAGKEGNPNAAAYSTSKAAVIGMTKSLGKELARSGITVNCVTPAAVKTPIFAQMSAAHIDYMLAKIPLGRFGTVEEVAALIAWLASRECSFSTGAVFDISGGRATY
ncbi:MAG: SDR family NAD(P)-dependent oxidoreductase [Acetobacteraceae bacterium]